MPTIEIISLDSKNFEIDQTDFDFAIRKEDQLISHRGLFYDFLLRYKGTMLYLGNPDFISNKESGFFAGKLIDWEFEKNDNFQFLYGYKQSVFRLIKQAFVKSRSAQAIFLTDIQANEPKARIKRMGSVEDFIQEHETRGLYWNTAYLINFQNIHDSLYSEIDSILWNDWDPIGVNDYGGPDDEYRDYIPGIEKMLYDSRTESEIAEHLDRIVTDQIGLNRNFEESKRIAKLLIRAKENDA